MPDVIQQADTIIQEVFLSPRVIDREAFGEYAVALRQLIQEAEVGSAALRTAAVEAQQAQNGLREAAAKHQPRLESAGRTLASIDARLTDAERLSTLASTAQTELLTLRNELARFAGEKIAEARAQAEGIIRQAQEQAQALRLQTQAEMQGMLDTRRVEVERLVFQAGEAEGRLASFREQADRVVGEKVAEVQRRADAVLAQGQAQSQLTRQQAQGEYERAVEVATSQARQIVQEAISSAESRLALNERQACERVLAFINAQIDGGLGGQVRELEARVNELLNRELPKVDLAAAQRSADLVDGAVARAQGLLADAGARTQKMNAEAQACTEQVQSLMDQSEQVRNLLGQAIEEATGRVDHLLDRAEIVKATAAAIAPACARAEERISTTLRQMETSAESARGVVADANSVVDRLGMFIEQLKPWGPILLAREGEDLPVVLQDAVDRACGRIRSEAAEIGGVLKDVSARMARFGVSPGDSGR